MTYTVDIQHEEEPPSPLTDIELTQWAITALSLFKPTGELTIRIVNPEEIRQLNYQYRQKDKPTNVLSFPCELPQHIELPTPLFGDIIICNEVIKKEAASQDKSYRAHFAHIVVHGVLHLLGFDHIREEDAQIMEPHEINILNQLGFSNPYEVYND